MKQLFVFFLLGLGPGALIAGLALAMLLQYRGSGVINIAMGAVATFGAYTYYTLKTAGYVFISALSLGRPLGTVPAVGLTLVACAALGLAIEFVAFRPLRTAAPLAKLVASLGVLLTIQALILVQFGALGQEAAPVYLDSPTEYMHVFGTPVPPDRILLAGIILVITLGLTALYRYSRFGLATRASAENETSAVLVGLRPSATSLVNTVLAALLAGLVGVLCAPTTQLDPVTITYTVIPAVGAALLAGFTSFPRAALWGLALGVVQTWLIYLQSKSWFPNFGQGGPLPGVVQVVDLIVIVAALWLRGTSLPQRGALSEQRLPPVPMPKAVVRGVRPMLLIAATAVLIVVFPPGFRQALVANLIGVVACLSLVVVSGFIGQMTLMPLAVAGVCGLAMQHAITDAGLGGPLPALIGVCVGTLAGVLTGLPALRVRGVNLAIVTLAAAWAVEQFVFNNTSWGQNPNVTAAIPSPRILGLDLGPAGAFPGWHGALPSPIFGMFCLVVAVIACAVVAEIRRSGLGQRMLAVRSNERAAAAAGLRVRNLKLAAFAVSSFAASVAGVLYAYNFSSVPIDRFDIVIALTFVAWTFIGGITTIGGALLGAWFVPGGVSSYALNKWLGLSANGQELLAGLLLIVNATAFPEGLALFPVHRHPPVRFARFVVRSVRSRGSAKSGAVMEAQEAP